MKTGTVLRMLIYESIILDHVLAYYSYICFPIEILFFGRGNGCFHVVSTWNTRDVFISFYIFVNYEKTDYYNLMKH